MQLIKLTLALTTAFSAGSASAAPPAWSLQHLGDGVLQAGLKPSPELGDMEFLVMCKPGVHVAEIEFRSTNDHGGLPASVKPRDSMLTIEVNGKAHGPVSADLVYDEPDAAWHFRVPVPTTGWVWRELASARTIVVQSPDRTVEIPMAEAAAALATMNRACS